MFSQIIQSYFSVTLDIRLLSSSRHKVISTYFPYVPTATVSPFNLPQDAATLHPGISRPQLSTIISVLLPPVPTPQENTDLMNQHSL
jgi:hypothetical protein